MCQTDMGEISGDRKVIYLHGDLDLHIVEARRLPNMDAISTNLRQCLGVCNACTTAGDRPGPADGDSEGGSDKEHHHHHPRNIVTSDPYVTVVVPQATLARTRVLKNAKNPRWKERFNIPMAHPLADLEFHVKDNDLFGAEMIGVAKIPAERIASGELIQDWFPIFGSNGKPPKPDSALHLEMKFTPCEKNPVYRHGIAGDPEKRGRAHQAVASRRRLDSWGFAQIVGTIFTHHQKCVLVDTQASGNNRKITAFIGGLDLCDGRYDTPEHRLFRDLDTVFKDDFHNPTFPVREDPAVFVSEENDPENWHVQIFRSIDSASLKGFPKTFDKCEAQT
ncbi:hypothetical protein Tsubulata_004906 [Turnera subulata]|uniref:phospholipase D n=1 Tax=Turnera subulata TaxID=218843 RepID=A0A9Q0G1G1_9ROSI|nr:hypothetical protein Tsubulata_004906 [Turnera subulata]